MEWALLLLVLVLVALFVAWPRVASNEPPPADEVAGVADAEDEPAS